MSDSLIYEALIAEHGPTLAAMLQGQPADYLCYFFPFAFDVETITSILASYKRDVYTGTYWRGQLVGMFMLRGWDAGYEIPAYGCMIDYRYSGFGLGHLAMAMGKSICKLRGVKRMMLRTHPNNVAARRIYERVGFVPTKTDPKTGQVVYYCDL